VEGGTVAVYVLPVEYCRNHNITQIDGMAMDNQAITVFMLSFGIAVFEGVTVLQDDGRNVHDRHWYEID
jgi:hypothetical protein